MDRSIQRLLPDGIDPAATLYITDRDLNVVYTNAEWGQFAASNHGEKLLGAGWNPNVLENFSGKQRVRWASIYRLLLEGRLPYHEEDFICSSPTLRRVYKLRITPSADESGEIAWLIHHSTPLEAGSEDAPDARAALRRQMREIDENQETARRLYREHVLLRKVTVPRYCVAQHLEPLEEVGGDLLWHREYSEGGADVVHADVSGHGDAAGRHATKIVLILDSLADRALNASEVVAELNRAMVENNTEDLTVFATGLFFRFHAEPQRLTCVNFGHHGPIFSRTGLIYLDSGLPVGVVEEIEPWPETEIRLSEHGNLFLVYSDGITEQFNMNGEMFGTQRLLDAFVSRLALPLDQMLEGIVRELAAFRGDAIVKDDQTLLALQFMDSAE